MLNGMNNEGTRLQDIYKITFDIYVYFDIAKRISRNFLYFLQ